MKYSDFENIISQPRMSRYLQACGGDTKKAMALYRYNCRVSQELLTVISHFEIALRNCIDQHYTSVLGQDWLHNSIRGNGIFLNQRCRFTAGIIQTAVNKLGQGVAHCKLLAELGFGFWRYLFAKPQFNAGRRHLLGVFPNKPRTTIQINYNNTYVFNQLEKINHLRNRIAHHEPICFVIRNNINVKCTSYVRDQYAVIMEMFAWLGIDATALLYGLDHVERECDKIDAL